MTLPDTHKESAPLGFDAEGWPLPEVRSMMIDNIVRSWTRHWIGVIVLYFVMIFLVMIPVMMMTPLWECNANIMLNEQSVPNLTVTSSVSTPVDPPRPDVTIVNLIEVARSRPFLLNVVHDLELDAYFRDQSENPNTRLMIKQKIRYFLTLKFLRGESETEWDQKAVDILQTQWVSSHPLTGSSMLPLVVYGDNPEKAIKVADAVLEHLGLFMDSLYREQIVVILSSLDNELDRLDQLIAADEQEIADFLTELGYISPTNYADQVLEGLVTLEKERATIALEIQGTTDSVETLANEMSSNPEFIDQVRTGTKETPPTRLSEALTLRLVELQGERDALLLTLPPTSIRVKKLEQQMNSMETEIAEARTAEALEGRSETETATQGQKHKTAYSTWLTMKNKLTNLQARQRGLDTAMMILKDDQRDAIQASQVLERLQRKKNKHMAQYDTRYTKKIEFETMLNQEMLYTPLQKVVDASVKNVKKADFPNLLLAGLIAIAVAVFTALVLPVGYDYINQTMMSSRQAFAIPGVRVIAAVPKMKSRKMYTSAST